MQQTNSIAASPVSVAAPWDNDLDPCAVTPLSSLKKAYDNLPLPIVLFDNGGYICAANAEFARLVGRASPDLVGFPFCDLLPAASRTAWRHHIKAVIKVSPGASSPPCELLLHRLNGPAELVWAHATQLMVGGERMIQVACQSADAAERIDFERQRFLDEIHRLRYSRRQLVDSLPALVTILDTDGQIIDWNAAFMDRLGLPAEALLCRSACWVTPTTECGSGHCVHLRAARCGEPSISEVESAPLRGLFLVNIHPRFTADGRLTGAIQVAMDVTEQRKVERQLAQAQKMECFGATASQIAHEFKNYLTSIHCSATSLRFRLSDEDDDTKTLIRIIETSASRGAQMARHLCDLARSEPGEQTHLNLHQLIEEAARLFQGALGPQFSIVSKLRAANPCLVANATDLQQTLFNLTINARDAMGDHGELRFETRNARVEDLPQQQRIETDRGEALVLEVNDNGGGIPSEILPRIFEPLFTTKQAGHGTGLGLPMVYNFVRRCGGVIDVTSTVGVGTTFTLVFPAAENRAAEEEEEPPMPAGGTETVLVVDDQETLCELGSLVLRGAGYTVLATTSAQHALELYQRQSHEIALVVFDLLMPGMNGVDLYRELRRVNPQVRGVLTSGCLGVSDFNSPIELSDVAMLPKPYTVHQLLATVRGALDQSAVAALSGARQRLDPTDEAR